MKKASSFKKKTLLCEIMNIVSFDFLFFNERKVGRPCFKVFGPQGFNFGSMGLAIPGIVTGSTNLFMSPWV